MDYAISLMLSLLLCLWAGHWLDEVTGASPWFTLLGMFTGMALGLGLLYKLAMKAPPPPTAKNPPDETPEDPS